MPKRNVNIFYIYLTDKLPKGNGIYVYFECEKLDQYVLELKEKGISFDLEPQDQRWLGREAGLKELDGNRLIFYHAGKNRLNPPWKIDV